MVLCVCLFPSIKHLCIISTDLCFSFMALACSRLSTDFYSSARWRSICWIHFSIDPLICCIHSPLLPGSTGPHAVKPIHTPHQSTLSFFIISSLWTHFTISTKRKCFILFGSFFWLKLMMNCREIVLCFIDNNTVFIKINIILVSFCVHVWHVIVMFQSAPSVSSFRDLWLFSI